MSLAQRVATLALVAFQIIAVAAFSAPQAAAQVAAGSATQSGTPAAMPFATVIDSVTALNRAAHWDEAQQLARAGFTTAKTIDEKCAIRAAGLLANVRLGEFENARRVLNALDVDCSASKSAQLETLRRELALPALPKTGVEFSAIDKFWPVADKLANDVEPSEGEWRAMMLTVGYRLSMQQISTTRTDMEIALKPSRRAELDSIKTQSSDGAQHYEHFHTILANRAMLARCRDSIAEALPIQGALDLMGKYLPPHTAETMEPPVVAFAYFVNDAYSLGPAGVIIDLDHICVEGGLTALLAHEFHHSYLSTLTTIVRPINGSPDGGIVAALGAMRNEGIADLIDKPYPLAYPNSPLMSRYATRYNEAYARTPQVLHAIDSVLAVAADDSTKLIDAGKRLRELLPSAGHFNGSYIAREIYETFGVDSLFPGVRNQFALLRTYAAAEKQHGNPPPFSPKSQSLLNALEMKYTKR